MLVGAPEVLKPVSERGVQTFEQQKADIVDIIIAAFAKYKVTKEMIKRVQSTMTNDKSGKRIIGRVNVTLCQPVEIEMESDGKKRTLCITELTWHHAHGVSIGSNETLYALHPSVIDLAQMLHPGEHADPEGQIPAHLQPDFSVNSGPALRRSTQFVPQPSTLEMLTEAADAHPNVPSGLDKVVHAFINMFLLKTP